MRGLLALALGPIAFLAVACGGKTVTVVVTATFQPAVATELARADALPPLAQAPRKPTATRVPPTPVPPTQPPEPTPAPTTTPSPQPVLLNGRGQFASQAITPPGPISVARFSHSGRSNFIVRVYTKTDDDTLINEIGVYQGARPIFGSDPITFDIQADGAWNLRLEAIGRASTPAFAGKGDNVSGLFEPPSRGAWEFTHTGRSNFIVHLYCAGGEDTIQNEIGPVAGSRVVSFSKGPCLWEVQADGEWALKPR